MNKKEFKIVFMGTPDFAVESLEALVENNFNIVGVITSPDRPAGRGQKINQSAVKKYAVDNNLNVLQPSNLKDADFQNELKSLGAHLQIIVAFRMLPESVWSMPLLGSINLHGSLLPQYRGAAPINWAVINGETKTGVTTFFLKHEIDTGDIIEQEFINIENNDTAGSIHDKLMVVGANLIVKTTQSIIDGSFKETPQNNLINSEIKHAPKIYKNDCKIDWTQPALKIQNTIRGLSPYPTAWSTLKNENGQRIDFKIFKSSLEQTDHNLDYGTVLTGNNEFMKIAVPNGFINILELQLAGKKRMQTVDFLRGFQQINEFSAI
ncbi:MAG: methionyl-tRNA formyltransferase [Salinivirgaceae bacterium]|jgi:methionyl-tRNA formyltransferase|nr:methionyl-tRNA formyltransferase [Salinivirgaceae bacterium]